MLEPEAPPPQADAAAVQEFHLTVANEGDTAVKLLAAASGFSKQKIKRLMQQGAVWLESVAGVKKPSRLRRASKALKAGDQVHAYYNDSIFNAVLPAAELVADEGAYSVWNKPCGMFSQGSKWGDHGSIVRWVEAYFDYQRPTFLVHRLDRATRGLIIVAHSKNAAQKMSECFETRAINKQYRAQVYGDHRSRPQPETIQLDIDGRHACSHILCEEYDAERGRSIVTVVIETGRKHQIRKHLASIAYPIVGDRLHGLGDDAEDLQLQACQLSFKSPFDGEDKHYQIARELF